MPTEKTPVQLYGEMLSIVKNYMAAQPDAEGQTVLVEGAKNLDLAFSDNEALSNSQLRSMALVFFQQFVMTLDLLTDRTAAQETLLTELRKAYHAYIAIADTVTADDWLETQ